MDSDAQPVSPPLFYLFFRLLLARLSSRHVLDFIVLIGFISSDHAPSPRASLHSCLLSSPQNCTRPSEPPVLSIPFIGMIVIVALIWCWWEELAS